jgi:ubiquinone biosynthesis protein COQ9
MGAESIPGADPDNTLRDRLADTMAAEAPFDGWGQLALSAAARQLGLPAGEAERLFPGGALQILSYLSERSDRRTVEEMENAGAGALKMRERIKLGVRTRL